VLDQNSNTVAVLENLVAYRISHANFWAGIRIAFRKEVETVTSGIGKYLEGCHAPTPPPCFVSLALAERARYFSERFFQRRAVLLPLCYLAALSLRLSA
jgi:hypothetical protein